MSIIFALLSSLSAFAFTQPNWQLTPGVLCSRADAEFQNVDYPEQIARCKRSVQKPEKMKIADEYGSIPESSWSDYEFDHLIPLCAGGANSLQNLWPQPIKEAKEKDILENDICLAMKAGTLQQAQAVTKVHDWFTGENSMSIQAALPMAEPPGHDEALCLSSKGLRIRFHIESEKQISHLSIRMTDANGEHEALNEVGSLEGRPAKVMKSELLLGHQRFTVHDNSNDLFEIFLPPDLKTAGKTYPGFLKFAFSGNFPTLEDLSCTAN